MSQALLIIDAQRALCEGPDAVSDAAAVLARINAVAAKVRAAGLPVIFVQHESSGPVLAYQSEGWQLAQALKVEPGDLRLRKTTPDSFHHTGLGELLAAHAVKRLIVCGMQSDFCVDTTTRRALALGYPVTLVSDAHSTVDNGVLSAAQIAAHHNTTLANIQSFGPRVTLEAADPFEPGRH